MKLVINVCCVLAMCLLIPCQGKDVTEEHQDALVSTDSILNPQVIGQGKQNNTNSNEAELAMKTDLEESEEEIFEEIGKQNISDEIKEMMHEMDILFGGKDDEQAKVPAGALGSVWIVEVQIGGYPSNFTNVMNGDKVGKEDFKTTTGVTETSMKDKLITDDYTEVPISMLNDDKIGEDNSNISASDEQELNENIAGEAEHEIEIEIEMELDLGEALEEEAIEEEAIKEEVIEEEIYKEYEEIMSDEIKKLLKDNDNKFDETDKIQANEPYNVQGPKLNPQGVISDDDEGGEDDHEGSGIEDQNMTIGMYSEMFKEVENEIVLEEGNKEINEDIESMKIEAMNSGINDLQQEEDTILEEMDILENDFIEWHEVLAIHNANDVAEDNKEERLYTQTAIKLVFLVSSGMLILSGLLLVIAFIVIVTKKKVEYGNPATKYIKRIRLISNTSTKSKEFLV